MNAQELAIRFQDDHMFTADFSIPLAELLQKVWDGACFSQQRNAYLDINSTTNSGKIRFTLPPFKIDSL